MEHYACKLVLLVLLVLENMLVKISGYSIKPSPFFLNLQMAEILYVGPA